MRYLLILCLFLSSCATSIASKELAFKKYQYFQDKLDKKRQVGYVRILKLRQARLIKKKEQKNLLEWDLILKSFQDSGIVLKSFEKFGCSIFDIAGLLNEYGKNDMDGFCDFLAEQYPFNSVFRWALDKYLFIPVKRNYELLKRLDKK